MKTVIAKLFTLCLTVTICSMLSDALAQANFTVLHTFSPLPYSPPFTNAEGAHPMGQLILSGDTLYGTTWQGTTNGNGAVFAMKTDGAGFTNLHTFEGPSVRWNPPVTNSEGALPQAGLALSGHTLYGTANSGGNSGVGTIFAVNTDGS